MTSRRAARLRIAAIALAVVAASLAIAACGDDDDSDSGSAEAGATTGTIAGGETISVQSIGGRDVLVDADGQALYTNDQDTAGEIACTAECAVDWMPVTTEAAQPGSDDPNVEAKLGVVANPDGGNQVTYDGKPLYTFIQDSPGAVTGDGFSDDFAGVTFVWTVASASGSKPSGTATTTTPETETESESEDSGSGSFGY